MGYAFLVYHCIFVDIQLTNVCVSRRVFIFFTSFVNTEQSKLLTHRDVLPAFDNRNYGTILLCKPRATWTITATPTCRSDRY